MNTIDISRIRELMMASLDKEISPEEEKILLDYLEQHPEMKREFDQLKTLKKMTSAQKLKEPGPEFWDRYKQSLYTRIERSLGWILLSIGAIVLLFYGVWTALSEMISDPSIAWWVKAAILSAAAGTIILLVSLIREKLFLNKHERYKDIIR